MTMKVKGAMVALKVEGGGGHPLRIVTQCGTVVEGTGRATRFPAAVGVAGLAGLAGSVRVALRGRLADGGMGAVAAADEGLWRGVLRGVAWAEVDEDADVDAAAMERSIGGADVGVGRGRLRRGGRWENSSSSSSSRPAPCW